MKIKFPTIVTLTTCYWIIITLIAWGAMPTQEKKRLRKLGNLKKIPEIFRFDDEYPAGNPKDKLWRFSVKNRKIIVRKIFFRKTCLWNMQQKAVFYLMKINLIASWITVLIPGAQLGRGRRKALSFFKNQKKCPYFRKKTLIVSILMLNSLFKM